MIYLDNAASAPADPAALEAAMPFLTVNFANPSSAHTPGREASLCVIESRERCAAALGANPDEIVFTSGGTESDNLAVFSAIGNAEQTRRKIVTTQIEHPAVLNAVREAEKRGFEAVYLAPDEDGLIPFESVAAAVDDRTALVSVMAANNEIGTIQPIKHIGELCRERGVLFHTDAVQAVGSIPIDLRELPADYLSVSAHKTGGLKGSGLLFVRSGAPLYPMMFGGGQEHGIRSGTENTAGIAALGAALDNITRNIEQRVRKITALRELLISRLIETIPDTRLNGSRMERLCGNVNVSFRGIDGEALVLNLDLFGVCASAASACSSGQQTVSHVLQAIRTPEEYLHGALRLSMSERNTENEVLEAAEIVRACVERLRTH
ncbi:MAG: cysteine desulfurase [Oscillospiraceae bacterium]|nr:cysteine desulfurase [Oscillospiraceae bacterium]